ncbi:hypothetical protein HZS_4696 [Henneguya salminicola]|nr:hypothetical protein HZS_4696 [Henneguya salminicola]
MVFDPGTNLYVPRVSAPLTCKSESLYRTLFHGIIVLIEYSWMPRYISASFEKGHIKAVKE